MASSNIRRRLCASSESDVYPTTPTLDDHLAANLQLLSLLESSAAPPNITSNVPIDNSDEELKRMLSLHSTISTASSAAVRHNAAQAQGAITTFKKIGAGSCGAIFAQDGKSLVVKLAKTDEHQDLWNDYVMHSSIAKQFDKYEIDEIKVPSCHFFVPKDDPHYFDQRPGLVDAAKQHCHLPTAALITERILPLPHATRTRLIEKYCSPKNKENALSAPGNKDCLVRVYLGSSHGKSGGMFFSLRNFKLHLNQMVDIQLDVQAMARRMAIAMAIMHWAAKTDARDVEFVLGNSTKKTSIAMDAEDIKKLKPFTYTGPESRADEDFFRRTTELWVLDFNQVRSITLDDAGVAQAVEAARLNDPYLPKPLQESAMEKRVWNEFVRVYISASDRILQAEGDGQALSPLPRMFIHGLIETENGRRQRTSPKN